MNQVYFRCEQMKAEKFVVKYFRWVFGLSFAIATAMLRRQHEKFIFLHQHSRNSNV